MPFSGSNIVSGAGTLYAAPLGTTEPSAASGTSALVVPSGWIELGYTAKGSTFDFKPSFSPIEVEEQLWPIRQVPTTYAASLQFELAEVTFQNWMLALNNGIGSSQQSSSFSTNSDGSKELNLPAPGNESRVMLYWSGYGLGTTSGGPDLGGLLVRQAVQTGQVQTHRQKGATIATIACQFEAEIPTTGAQPISLIVPFNLSA